MLEILSILFLSLSFCRHIYDDMDDTHILFFFSLWIFPFVHTGYFPLVFPEFFPSFVGFSLGQGYISFFICIIKGGDHEERSF